VQVFDAIRMSDRGARQGNKGGDHESVRNIDHGITVAATALIVGSSPPLPFRGMVNKVQEE
jgi:hypothetical protein